MKKFVFLLVLLLSVALNASSDTTAQKVLRVSDGKIITFNQMVDDLKKVSVVFVGEIHDVPEHHRAELNIIKAVQEPHRALTIGLEMFRADSQPTLNSWVEGRLPLNRFLPVYYDNWRLPWPLYQDIFLYARDQKVAMAGLNIPDAISRKVAARGFGSLTPDEKKQLPPGISCNVDPTYMDFIKRAYAGHHGHDQEFVNFCEAQMIWDKTMAWHVTGYLKKNPGKTMAVLAGVGHAWKRGIPEQLDQLGPDPKLSYRVVLPVIPDQIDRESVTTRDADYVLLD